MKGAVIEIIFRWDVICHSGDNQQERLDKIDLDLIKSKALEMLDY